MKHYKDLQNNIYAYESDGSQDDYIKTDLVAITDAQAEAIRNPPKPIASVRAGLISALDTYIGSIYSRFTRFDLEYKKREAAARAFKAGGYLGLAGIWVKSFADSAGMTEAVASDLIITQADKLNQALENIAAIRMRKYTLNGATTEAQAQALYNAIINDANWIAAQL